MTSACGWVTRTWAVHSSPLGSLPETGCQSDCATAIARAGARTRAVLNLYARIPFSLEFLGSHEFDAHFLGAAWNLLLKLKIARLWNGCVTKLLENLREL